MSDRVIYTERLDRKEIKNNQDNMYVFGDNDERKGLGGQAKECRGEPNALGIRVKKKTRYYRRFILY